MTPQIPFYISDTEDSACIIQLINDSDFEHTFSQMTEREQQWISHQSLFGKAGDTCMIYGETGQLVKAVMVDKDEDRHLSLAKLVTQLPAGQYRLTHPLTNEELLGWGTSQYFFEKYQKKEIEIKQLQVSSEQLAWLDTALTSIFLVRDLINTPANDMGPSQLAASVRQVADQFDAEFREIIGDDLLIENYPAIHTVGRASGDAPRLVSLHWGDTNSPHIVLVGKGVCFDSGGLDIKPARNMRLMKKDMGGAANAIGLAYWLMSHKLPIRLSVYIAAVENAVGTDAYRPGDVITMRNGLTVEVDNTDAEGRLVLADAITRACEDEPELIIDIATLTGAARVAVGTDIAAMFCNDDVIAKEVESSSQLVNDPVCRLPLYAGYEKMLDSSIADISNSPASSYAGAITAALFLKRFVEDSISWLHFDVMAWNLSNKPGKPEGGEAMAIRTLANYLIKQYGG